MKLLVFAHTPPPIHGQSVMVQTLVDGLGRDPGFQILHVNPQLSRHAADIGRWRPGKVLALLRACRHAWRLRRRHGAAHLYYVPAPAKRGALYRDFLVMLLCRPLCSGLILHWHAAGLGAWLRVHATPVERWLAQRLLGQATLAIVLGENLRDDAAELRPRRLAVVRNGIPDPCPAEPPPPRERGTPLHAVFIGLCAREKGLFDAIAAVCLANADTRRVRLSVAGDFPDATTAAAFAAAAAQAGGAVHHVGFVQGPAKAALLRDADVLVFPTCYPHETQGLVVAEALAFDLPVIITRWRAVHEGLPARHVHIVTPGRPDEIADALAAVIREPPPAGELRQHFLARLTRERHLADLAAALHSLR